MVFLQKQDFSSFLKSLHNLIFLICYFSTMHFSEKSKIERNLDSKDFFRFFCFLIQIPLKMSFFPVCINGSARRNGGHVHYNLHDRGHGDDYIPPPH